MKIADIKVGEDYVYGTRGRQGTYQRVRALEIGKHAVKKGGDAVHAVRVDWVDAMGEPFSPSSPWIVIRQVIMLWSEYEAQRSDATQGRERQYDQTMVVRVNQAITKLADLQVETGTLPSQLDDARIYTGWVNVRVEFLEEVAKLLVDRLLDMED
jgi:hypothetical protein